MEEENHGSLSHDAIVYIVTSASKAIPSFETGDEGESCLVIVPTNADAMDHFTWINLDEGPG